MFRLENNGMSIPVKYLYYFL